MDFDDLAQQYDAWFKTPLGAYVDVWEKRLTWNLAEPRKGETVLDIGVGTANYVSDLRTLGVKGYGIDVSVPMLHVALEKARRGPFSLEVAQARAEALPFRDASFDLVLSVTALEFVPDPQRAVAEMKRVCRPGGRIVVSVLNKWSLWAARRRLISFFNRTIFSECRFYSGPELKRLFGAATYHTCVFAPPKSPALLVPMFDGLEPVLQKCLRPFGAYLIVRVDV